MKRFSQASIFKYGILLLAIMLIGCGEEQNSTLSKSKLPLHEEPKSLQSKQEIVPKPIIPMLIFSFCIIKMVYRLY